MMERTVVFLVVLLATLVSGSALAQTKAPHAVTFRVDNHVLPVLVAVDAKGRVTSVDPPIRLRTPQRKALMSAVRKMITAPATDRLGHAESSQFVMLLAIEPGTDGVSTFKYAGSRPVQSGPMHWVRVGTRSRARYSLMPASSMVGASSDNSATTRATEAFYGHHPCLHEAC